MEKEFSSRVKFPVLKKKFISIYLHAGRKKKQRQ